MADYYSLVKKAVARLDPDAPIESRRAIYERARIAQLTNLRTISPPLSEPEIAHEQLALEEALRRVEAEVAHHASVPALNDLVSAADTASKTASQTGSGSSITQARSQANPFSPSPTIIEERPPMTFTGGATGRLIRYWRWRWFPSRRPK